MVLILLERRGKSYLAKAIGIVAYNNYKIEYHHCETLLDEMVALKATDYSKDQQRMKKEDLQYRIAHPE